MGSFHDLKTKSCDPHINTEDRAIISYNAQNGDSAAQVLQGDIFKEGNGVDQDLQVAINWYTRAADQGYARSQFSSSASGSCTARALVSSRAFSGQLNFV